MLVHRKAMSALRAQYAEKRGGGDVRGHSGFGLDELGKSGYPGIDHIPDPLIAEHLCLETEELFERLDDPLLRSVALQKFEGYTNKEIAEKNSIALRSVERKLNVIRKILSESH